ncbi:hypothetical protein SAMD00019534_084570 [Acytostelium subglobosum LB1]|uniref:hypothetical protein n=1 Tax=Acytostelium subglobosum LB1 TaxID=1410327 RepID=UPI000644FDD1|nr:hypothetical protein SAMD00019534_084570 [Acytostelium subglobosum LB1]GAM25282.1 hypothetical protein SAMD00019534_084570 [Acytostelium subglobosum LB1]|eukprot:XP_012751802.1 hypothetical protein SAMD00019534_084570 [Acytostelium subglobosum LB1]
MTNESYTNCNQLVDKFGTEEFAILGFPCAQFINQEPGSNEEEILHCLKYVRPGNNFEPNFMLFEKSDVNGPTTNSVFTWLKSGCGPSSPTLIPSAYISWTPVMYNDIEWNFAKFLVSKTGELVRRYSPETFPQFLSGDIAELISQ